MRMLWWFSVCLIAAGRGLDAQPSTPDSALKLLELKYLQAASLVDIQGEAAMPGFLTAATEVALAYVWSSKPAAAGFAIDEVDSLGRACGGSVGNEVQIALKKMRRTLSDDLEQLTSDPDRADLQRSIPAFRTLAQLARLTHSLAQEAWAAEWLVKSFAIVGPPDSVVAWASVAESKARDAGTIDALPTIALLSIDAYEALGNARAAKETEQRTLRDVRAVQEYGTLLRAALAESEQRPDSALTLARMSLELARKHDLRMQEHQAVDYIGRTYSGQARIDSARVFFAENLRLARERGLEEHEGRALAQLAELDSRAGLIDSALVKYSRAVELFGVTDNVDDAGDAMREMASVHASAGNYSHALDFLRAALRLQHGREKEFARAAAAGRNPLVNVPDKERQADLERRFHHNLVTSYLRTAVRLGGVFEQVGMPDSAAAQYREALKGYQANDSPSGTSLALIALAQLELKQSIREGRPHSDSAIALARRAVRASQDAASLRQEITSRFLLAQTYMFARGLQSSAATLANLDSAIQLSTVLAARPMSDASRISLTESQLALQDLWMTTRFWLADSVRTRSALLTAVAAGERVRARSLLALLQGDSRFALSELESEGMGLSDLPRKLNASILSYHTSEYRTDAVLLTPDGGISSSYVMLGADTLADLAVELRRSLGVAGGPEANDGARSIPSLERSGVLGSSARGSKSDAIERLQRALLPKSLADRVPAGGDLIIVPHGALSLIPFSALAIDGDTVPLGIRYALRFTPSITVLAQIEAAKGHLASRGLTNAKAVIVGNPTMPRVADAAGRTMQLPPLPGAAAEAGDISSKLHSAPLSGGAATESEVRLRLPGASLIHLATHGFAYSAEEKSRESFIALAPDARNDGRLTVAEVLDDPSLKLNADLVVLSACQTGLGNLKRSEGTIGLQRAFLAKGARTLMVSLWSVSDEATSVLMRRFYDHWLDDRDKPGKAESLRRAQADVRGDARFSHPKYWAAFQLAGGS